MWLTPQYNIWLLKGDQQNKIFIIAGIIGWAILKDKRLENRFKKSKTFTKSLRFCKAGDLTNISKITAH